MSLPLFADDSAATHQARPRPGCGQSADSALPGRHDKDSQRDRLLAAIVAVCCEYGYEDTTIARVIDQAGVSRPTFYEYFAHKEACLLAASEGLQHRMVAATRRSIAEQPPQEAAASAIAALVRFTQEHPLQARFLMNETMAAGPPALDARDRGVGSIAGLIRNAYRHVSLDTLLPALPEEILVGTLYRLLGLRLARSAQEWPQFQADLLAWLAAYESPAELRRWRALTPAPAPPRSPFLAPAPLRAPPALAPGRPRRSAPEVSENHRLRIIFATAEIVSQHGYAATTVAEITRAAGIDGRVFYKLFAGKRDAFAAVREFAFQNAMAVTAGAFFAGEGWPQRVWQAGATFTQYLQEHPALTYACVVESHAGGPEAAQRLQDLVAGFTIFLQEGYSYRLRRSAPSRVALEAVAQANFEIIYRQARSSSRPAMAGLLAHLAYVSLTPFVGAAKADVLIRQMGREETS
jgi:AcrR family transcriptional regulator